LMSFFWIFDLSQCKINKKSTQFHFIV